MNCCKNLPIRLAFALLAALLPSVGQAEVLHVDDRAGRDDHPGTCAKPLKTIYEAARRVNASTNPGPATVLLAPGRYDLDRCVTFGGDRTFTEQDRLTIRAATLPDDPAWRPESMPTILSSERPETTGGITETYCLKVKTSHVTIHGLRFLGNSATSNMHCCVERVGADLDDLLVTQCLFLGDPDGLNIYCAALATGDRFVVDHCVFSKCHACTVYWDGLDEKEGKGCAMRYCIVEGALISGVWTCQTAEDFDFHHNVIAGGAYVWMRKPGDRQRYQIRDCAIVSNEHFSGYGVASGAIGRTGPEVRFDRANVTTSGRFEFASDHHTHLAADSIGRRLGAGLFRNRKHRRENRNDARQ